MEAKNTVINLQSILSPIAGYLNEIDSYIKSHLQSDLPLLNESSTHIFLNGGKKIRAALVILANGLKGMISPDIVPIASASEIVHAATLIHDDIIDQSLLRRGMSSVPAKWGNKISVLVGDYMYTLALDVINTDGNPGLIKVMINGTSNMIKGELYQLQFSSIDTINRDHYLRIIELKTAIFMGCCAKLGAIKAGFSSEEQEKLYNFGYYLGFAFQIVDDTFDYMDKNVTGKDSGNDYLSGKITLPYIYLLEQANARERKQLEKYAKSPDEENWGHILELIKTYEVPAYAQNVAASYIEQALKYIREFPDSEFRSVLFSLAEFFIDRKY